MIFGYTLAHLSDLVLPIPLFFILFASIVLTFKTKFIQIRMIPRMIKLLVNSIFRRTEEAKGSIQAHKALFTAMSTTIGIGNIVGPAMAVRLGGPGALLIFLLVMFFGAATVFSEVTFAMHFRKHHADGFISGGPMQYLKAAISPWLASIYAFFGAILLVVWSSNQSNTLADILVTHNIPHYITGCGITLLVIVYLVAGIKNIGDLSAKLVPFMFVLYCLVSLWVVVANITKLPSVFSLMFNSLFSVNSVMGAGVGIGIQRMLRWGFAKGIQASEAGTGTQTIPHSKSSSTDAIEQGVLSMVSIYSVGFICLLSGLVTLLTGTWNDPSVPVGINQIAQGFAMYFPSSSIILACCSFMFAFGTILGNAFNGSQCYLYLTKNKWIYFYYVLVGAVVFLGSISDVEFIWTVTDFFIIPVALSNLIGILYLAFTRSDLLETT